MAAMLFMQVLALAVIRATGSILDFDDIGVHDHVMLLQTEASVQVNRGAMKAAPAAPLMEEEASLGGAWQEFCGDCAAPSEAAAEEAILPAAAKEAVIAAPIKSAPLEPSRSTCASTFAAILEALVVIIVLDAGRRLKDERKAKKATKSAPPVPCSGFSWESFMEAASTSDEKTCMNILDASRGDQFTGLLSRTDAWGCSALHAAAKGGSVSVVKRLLKMGASVSVCDAWDETPLHIAARAGKTACCEALLEEGAEIDAINADDRTPLVVAADAGSEPTAQLLLDRGATAGGLSDEELPKLLASMLFRELLLSSCRPGAGLPSSPAADDDEDAFVANFDDDDDEDFAR